MYDVLTARVAARYLRAIEFPSEEARKEYLHEHPGADPAKHTVKERGDSAAPAPGASEKAKAWLGRATGAVRSFFADPKARQEGLAKASKRLKDAAASAGRSAVDSVKKELAEAKDAFAGLKSVMTGGSMTDTQKTALKKVALKTATSLASTALIAAFPAAVVHSVVGKNVAKHVAQTVLRKVLGHATGVKLAAADAGTFDAEQWLGSALAVAVSDVLSKLSDEDVRTILESSASDDSSV